MQYKRALLTLYQTTHLRLVQIQSICRRQNNCILKTEILWVENVVGKGSNAGYQHFLLFSQYFQKASFFKVVKIRDCVVNG